MDHIRPANGSADVCSMLTALSKWLVSVIVLILSGCGGEPSLPAPIPEPQPSKVNAPDLGESIFYTPDGKRRETPLPADPSVTKSPPRKTITPGKNRSDSSDGLGKTIKTSVGTRISNVTLHNEAGRAIYRGSIDLKPTLDRIRKGQRNLHRNDGAVFQNREGRLPQKRAGYYHEYVVPTPGVSGPGPQRLIVGSASEYYYTSDHYKSFQRIRP